jgi:RHS repeat-associated protein
VPSGNQNAFTVDVTVDTGAVSSGPCNGVSVVSSTYLNVSYTQNCSGSDPTFSVTFINTPYGNQVATCSWQAHGPVHHLFLTQRNPGNYDYECADNGQVTGDSGSIDVSPVPLVGSTLTIGPAAGDPNTNSVSVGQFAVYDYALSYRQWASHSATTGVAAQAPHTFGQEVNYSVDAGDPVNTFSGSLTHVKTDLSYPSYVYGMDFTRTLNSGDASPSPMGLGVGWSTNLDTSLLPLGDGNLLYRGPEGRRVELTSGGSGTNTWAAPELIQGQVTKNTTTGTYALQFNSGERWQFDSAGRLTTKCQGRADGYSGTGTWCGTAGNGQFVTITHNGPGGLPDTVTSSLGFVQRLTITSSGVLMSITGDDNGNNVPGDATDRVVNYSYDGFRFLTSAEAPHYSTDATYPVEVYAPNISGGTDNRTKTIKARDNNHADAQATVVVDNTFDATTGRVKTQTLRSGQAVSYTYDDTTVTTTVVNGSGADMQTTKYVHDATGRVTEITDTTGKKVTTTWDANSRKTSVTDRSSVGYGYTYDGFGRLVQVLTPDPNALLSSGFMLPNRQGDGTFPAPNPTDGWGLETYTYLIGAGSVTGDERVVDHTDANGVDTQYFYDLTNHPESPIPVKTTVGSSANKLITYNAISAPVNGANEIIGTQDGDGVTTCNYYNPTNGLLNSTLKIVVAAENPVTDATAIGSISSTITTTCNNHATDATTKVGRTSYTYTPLGQVATKTPPELQGGTSTWNYSYFGFGPLETQTDPLGNQTSYTYDPFANQASITQPGAAAGTTATTTTTYGYALTTGCDSVNTPCSTVTTVGPRDGKFISGTAGPKVDETTVVISDAAGNVRELEAPGADQTQPKEKTSFTYGPLGRLTEVVDPAGAVTQFQYDANGNRTAVIKGNISDGDATETTLYSLLNLPLTVSTAKNDSGAVTTKYTYNKTGQTLTTSVATGTADQSVTTNVYDLGNGLLHQSYVTRTDAPHNASGGVAATLTNTYTPGGRTACVDTLVDEARDGSAAAHEYQGSFYDDGGRLRLSTTPIQGAGAYVGCTDHTTSVTHLGRTYYQPDTSYWGVTAHAYFRDDTDAEDQDPTQYVTNHPSTAYAAPTVNAHYGTAYTYDADGRRTITQTPNPSNPAGAPAKTTTCYTARGEVASTVDPLNHVVGYTYTDDAGQVATATNPDGMTYHASCASVPTNGKKGTATFTYDGNGNRLSRSTWNDALTAQVTEQWAYDTANRVHTYSDQNTPSHITSYDYTLTNGIPLTTTVTTGSPADSSKRTVTTTNFKSGQPASVVATQYGPDGTTVTATDTVAYTYDNVGRQKTVTENPGAAQKQTTFAYNQSGQRTQVTLPDTTTEQAQWDLAGKLTQLTYPSGTVMGFDHDARGLTSGVNVYSSAVGWSALAAIAYDANGAISNEVMFGWGGLRAYTRDPQTGELTEFDQALQNNVVDNSWSLTYDAAGRVASDCAFTSSASQCTTSPLPSGVVSTAYTYDNANQLTGATITNAPAGTPSAWAYSYGNNGNRTSQTVTNGTTTTTKYLYDNANELCAARITTNPTSCTDTNATRYSYDWAGRRTSTTPAGTSTPSATTTYDPRGKPTTNTFTDGTKTVTDARTYDAFGNLTNQNLTEPGGTNNTEGFYWDMTGNDPVTQPLEWLSNGIVNDYDYGPDRVLANEAAWMAYDDRGSTIGTTATNSWQGAPGGYDPFGAPTPIYGAYNAAQDDYLSYRGETTIDGQTIDLRARDYDPATGTFTTRDPLDGVNGTTTVANPYHYVGNDPLNMVDPLGLQPTDPDFGWREGASCGGSGIQHKINGSFECDPNPADQAKIDARKQFDNRNNSATDCKAAHGISWQDSTSTCYLPPLGNIDGALCYPPLTDSGQAIVYDAAGNGCGAWIVTEACAHFASVPGLNWVCQNGDQIKLGAQIILAGALTVASGGSLGPEAAAEIAAEESGGELADVGATEAADGGSADEPVDEPQCALSSFAPDTPVVMANGTEKPIRDVTVGDSVLATDPATGTTEGRPVTATMSHDDDDLRDLTILDGDGHQGVLRTTDHHRFWSVTAGAWVLASDLHDGDQLRRPDGSTATLVESQRRPGHEQMLDLTVQGDHTFYVDYGGATVLVHNAGGDPVGDCGGDPRCVSNPSRGRYDEAWSSADAALEGAQQHAGSFDAGQKMVDPATGSTIGERSVDGRLGWRIDDDHVNWWNWSGGKKGTGGEYGHDFFPSDEQVPHSEYIGYADWEEC